MSGMSLSISSEPLDGVLNSLKRAKGAVTTELTKTLDQVTNQARRTVAAGTPVRTGTAQRGVRSRSTGPLSREVYNDVSYFIFLVLGTRYMGASVMLNQAIDKAAKESARTLEAIGSRLAPEILKAY